MADFSGSPQRCAVHPGRRRQAFEPGAVGGDRQAFGQAIAQQAGQFAVAVERREQALQGLIRSFLGFAVVS
jgi:hypothetical protein